MKNKKISFRFIKIHCHRLLITLVLITGFFLLIFSQSAASDYSTNTVEKILQEYFPQRLISQLKKDTDSIIKYYNGINVFSTCQYGDKFLTGTIDIGDIFDARIPGNYKIFQNYARDNLLVQNVDEDGHCNKYAMAAGKFLKEFDYDAVIFYPDEFHPLFTKPNDTWMFIREESSGKKHGKYYFSSRMSNRQFTIEGGLDLEPLKTIKEVQYYIPIAGTSYTRYILINSKDTKSTCEPVTGNKNMTDKRRKAGIIPSSLSNRKNLKVGLWTKGKEAMMELKYGPCFRATGVGYTWGDKGFYVVPLERDFWEEAIIKK